MDGEYNHLLHDTPKCYAHEEACGLLDGEHYVGGSGASGSDTRLKNKSEYDEILERLDTVVDANTRRVANLRGAVARVLGEPERDKDLCEDITMSQTLNRLAEQLDANNKMLDKILEKTRRAVGSLKLFTD